MQKGYGNYGKETIFNNNQSSNMLVGSLQEYLLSNLSSLTNDDQRKQSSNLQNTYRQRQVNHLALFDNKVLSYLMCILKI